MSTGWKACPRVRSLGAAPGILILCLSPWATVQLGLVMGFVTALVCPWLQLGLVMGLVTALVCPCLAQTSIGSFLI
jgi:hypothetical protein